MIYYSFLGLIGKKEKQKEFLHKMTSNWARHLVKLTGSKVELIGEENIPEGNVLYVSNHQGNFDIPLMLGYVPKLKGFVAKTELKKMPMVNSWMEALGCIFIDRSNLRQSLKAILKGVDSLKQGNNLVIFPEGTRSKGNEMSIFKKGSLKLATKSGATIVPITINGSYKILEEHKRIRPANIKIHIHTPIDTKDMSMEEKNKLVDTLYEIIKEPLN
jgi:1-acyl-sn-glycerol-3-phosphate acyltransferase